MAASEQHLVQLRRAAEEQALDFTVKKGDRVIFSSYAGTEIKIDGEEYLIMTEDDILGTIDG